MTDDTRSRIDRRWCRHVSAKGKVCALYLDHYGNHKTKHLDHEWTEDGKEIR